MSFRRFFVLILVLAALPGRAQTAPAAMTAGEARVEADRVLSFIPRVAASFTGGAVTGDEIRQLMKAQLVARFQAGVELSPEQLQQWARVLAESELDHQLLLQQAAAAGYTPDLLGAREELAQRRDQMGDEAFAQTMAMQGVPADVVVRKLAENRMVNKWVSEQVAPTITATEEDAKDYYDKHLDEFTLPASRRLWHILIAVPPDTPKERRKLSRQNAEDILQRLREGVSFQRMAKSGSDCPSAVNEGDLGLVPLDQLNKALQPVAKKLAFGEISAVIESTTGYHLLMAGATVPEARIPFAEVKQRILRRLQGELAGQAMDRLKQNAREAAHAEVHIPEIGE